MHFSNNISPNHLNQNHQNHQIFLKLSFGIIWFKISIYYFIKMSFYSGIIIFNLSPQNIEMHIKSPTH